MSEQDKEQKTEEATTKQREKFRERGDVAKSPDVAAVAAIIGGTGAIVFFGPTIAAALGGLTVASLGRLDTHGNEAMLFIFAGRAIVAMIAPVAVAVLLLGIAAQAAQVGFKPSLKPMKPNFSKFNPLPQLRKLFFSATTFIELLKSLVKVAVIGFLACRVLYDELIDNGRLSGLTSQEILVRLGEIGLRIVIHVGIAICIIAVIDLLIARHRHEKKMRMTKQQVKDEHKQSEGDPLVRGRVRGRQREMVRRRMLEAVDTSDVVVVNPTHYSAALRYRLGVDVSPVIVALGVDDMASKIRQRARSNNVPVVSDPKLARALYSKGKVGGFIPPDLYRAVASLLAWVYSMTGKAA